MDINYETDVLWPAITAQYEAIRAKLPKKYHHLLDELEKRYDALLIFEGVYLLEEHKERGRRGAHKANNRKAARRPDYGAAVRRLMAAGVKYIPACESVANQFDVTWQTVRNNTPSLRPKRRLKKQ